MSDTIPKFDIGIRIRVMDTPEMKERGIDGMAGNVRSHMIEAGEHAHSHRVQLHDGTYHYISPAHLVQP
jgi:hypothetical protein